MSNLFFIFFLISIIAIIIGLIKPNLVIHWGDIKNRRQVIKVYGLTMLISLLLSISFQKNFGLRDFLTAFLLLIFFVSIFLMLIGLIKPTFVFKNKENISRKDIFKIFGNSIVVSFVLAAIAIPPVTTIDNIENARELFAEERYYDAIEKYNSVLDDWDEEESADITKNEINKELQDAQLAYFEDMQNKITSNLENDNLDLAKGNLALLEEVSSKEEEKQTLKNRVHNQSIKQKIILAENNESQGNYREANNIYKEIIANWNEKIDYDYSKGEINTAIDSINSNHTVIVDISIIGKGSISHDQGEHKFYENEVLKLKAKEKEDEKFIEWTGDVQAKDNELSIKMDQNKSIIARFKEKEYNLSILTEGNGNIEVDPHKDHYNYNDKVTLSVEPDKGWEFDNWSNDIRKNNKEVTLNITENTEVKANFSKKEFILDINTSGEGNIEVQPDKNSYEYGDIVEIIADPNDGWYLADWANYSGSNNKNIEIKMENNQNITAIFQEKISDLDFHNIYNNADNMTDAQFDKYKDEIIGERISWTGYVVEVKEEFLGDNYEVWIDMHDPSELFSVQNVYLKNIDSNIALSLNKNDRISFEGNITSVNKVLGTISINLNDVIIR